MNIVPSNSRSGHDIRPFSNSSTHTAVYRGDRLCRVLYAAKCPCWVNQRLSLKYWDEFCLRVSVITPRQLHLTRLKSAKQVDWYRALEQISGGTRTIRRMWLREWTQSEGGRQGGSRYWPDVRHYELIIRLSATARGDAAPTARSRTLVEYASRSQFLRSFFPFVRLLLLAMSGPPSLWIPLP